VTEFESERGRDRVLDTVRDRYQPLNAVDAELQVIDVSKEGVEGRDQAVDHLKTDPDLLSLALAEGAEDLPSEHHGAQNARILRGCPRRSQLQGLDGGLVDPPQRPLVAADEARPDLQDVTEVADTLLWSRTLADGNRGDRRQTSCVCRPISLCSFVSIIPSSLVP
jgi:hypothetical protein